jgi:hypothetical protein
MLAKSCLLPILAVLFKKPSLTKYYCSFNLMLVEEGSIGSDDISGNVLESFQMR